MSYLLVAYAITLAGLGLYARSLQRELARLEEASARTSAAPSSQSPAQSF